MSAPLIVLGFVAVLAGRFTLDRIGFTVPLLNDPRTVLLWLLFAGLAFEWRRARGSLMQTRHPAMVSMMLLLFGYQAMSALWAPAGARVLSGVADLAAMAALVLVFRTLGGRDPERVIRIIMGGLFVAACVYFLGAASGHGHDPSGRWAALGGGSNVFVRIMVLGIIAALYLYLRNGRIAWLAPIPAFLAGAIFSGSRGGLLAAILILMIAGLVGATRIRGHRAVPMGLTGLLLAAITWFAAGDQISAVLRDRILTATFENRYTSERDILFQAAVEMFARFPVFGSGLDGFFALTTNTLGAQYVHCLPLAIAAEGGLVGLLLFLGAAVTLFCACRLPAGRKRSLEGRTAVYCGLFIGFASLFSGGYYDSRFMWIFLMLAALTSSARCDSAPGRPLPPGPSSVPSPRPRRRELTPIS